ncbi:MAG: ribonuclease III [Candidatus Aminicenantales bacterium]
MDSKILNYQKNIGYYFRKEDLLLQALTHSSYAYESQEKAKDNEVLEFLGDSVLGLIIADFFCSTYPHFSEGELSKLKSSAVSTHALSQLAHKIKLYKYILLGKGEERSGGRDKKTILAGAFEALVGAIYLDGGFESARTFLLNILGSPFKKIKSEKFLINNYKSALQEHLQKTNLSHPVYRTITSTGPDHKKIFVVEVYANGEALAKAKGYSKKNAEQKAAENALRRILGRKIKPLSQESFLLKK